MVGAGAGAGILTGLAESALSSGGAVSAAGSAEAVDKPKVSGATKAFDGVIKPKSNLSSVTESVPNKQEMGTSGIVDKPEAKIIPEAAKAPVTISATVELSSKGFLQDIHNLKANIIKQYGNNIPEEIKTKIIDKPTPEIAKEYGLYKPGHINESAVGYAGEKLSLDSNGQLIIERVDGTKETLSGLGRESAKVAVPEVDTNTPSVPTPENLADVPVKTMVIETKIIPELDSRVVPTEHVAIPDEPEIIQDTGTAEKVVNHTAFGVSEPGKVNTGLDVIDKAGSKTVVLDGVEIAHEQSTGVGKMLVLDDKFRSGVQNSAARKAFAEVFEQSDFLKKPGVEVIPRDFEGGKIYLVRGLNSSNPAEVKSFVYGEEFATGSFDGTKLKMSLNSGRGGGFFGALVETPYERAFREVKNVVKGINNSK